MLTPGKHQKHPWNLKQDGQVLSSGLDLSIDCRLSRGCSETIAWGNTDRFPVHSLRIVQSSRSSVDRNNPPPPGGFRCWVVSKPRTQRKTVTKIWVIFQGGSSSSESLVWKHPYKEPPPAREGRFLTIKVKLIHVEKLDQGKEVLEYFMVKNSCWKTKICQFEFVQFHITKPVP